MRAHSSKRLFVLWFVGLSGCGMQFNGKSAPPPTWEGTTLLQPHEPRIWSAPCSVSTGTRFTARLDRAISTDTSRPGDPFTAHVVTPVVSSCDLEFISKGAVLRGRVARSEAGELPVLALELVDVDTSTGAQPIAAAIRSGEGFAWIEINPPHARSSYQAFVIQPWETVPSGSTLGGSDRQLTLPAEGEIELELVEPVQVLP
jgi:hypothetical protein